MSYAVVGSPMATTDVGCPLVAFGGLGEAHMSHTMSSNVRLEEYGNSDGWMDGSDRRPTPGSRQRAVPVPRRSPYTAQMRVSPQPMGYPIGVGIGAIGVHTSGTSSPGSSARHPTVRASSRRREATGTCLDEVTPLGPTPEGRPIKAGIHPLHLGPCRPLRQARAAVRR